MKIIARIAVLCLSICLILSCASCASPAETEQRIFYAVEPSDSYEDLEYISNLGTEKYNLLLDTWRGSGFDPIYPSFYGGCYAADNKDFILLVTSLDQDVIDYFGDLIDLGHVGFFLVEHSFQELLDDKAVMSGLLHSGAFGEKITNLFTGIGIAQQENAVNIYLATEDFKEVRGTIETIYAEFSSHQCPLRFVSLYPGW